MQALPDEGGLLHEGGESFLKKNPDKYGIENPHTFLRGLGKKDRKDKARIGRSLTDEERGFVARVLGDKAQDGLTNWLSDTGIVVLADGWAKTHVVSA